MSLAAVAIVAFFAVLVLPRATLPMADGDAWWHIHAGEEIIATGRVPDTNTWTIAGDGFAWTSQDWASNVGMALLFNAGEWGVAWLSLAFALVVVGAFALLWMAVGLRSPAPGWLGRILWLSAGLVAAGPIIGIRVQTIDLLMAAATVCLLWWYLSRPRPAIALLLVATAVLWVNLHAGWVMLFLLGGAVVVGEAADRWIRRRPAALAPRDIATLAGSLLAAAAALVLNPNGLEIYLYPFRTASIDAHRDFLVEWSPPNLAGFEGQVAIAAVVVTAITVGLAWRRMRMVDLLWAIGLSVLTLYAVRFVLFLGPIGAALAAVHLTPLVAESRLGEATRPLVERWSRTPSAPLRGRINATLLVVVAVLGVGIATARAAPASQAPAIDLSIPADAATWLETNRPDARIFNTYSWGGYLSRRLPAAKAYIDGRSDVYGNEPIQRYAAALTLASDPSSLLDGASIDAALLRPEYPLNEWLATAGGWHVVYEDDRTTLWIRDQVP
jgi:hypothetical protein